MSFASVLLAIESTHAHASSILLHRYCRGETIENCRRLQSRMSSISSRNLCSAVTVLSCLSTAQQAVPTILLLPTVQMTVLAVFMSLFIVLGRLALRSFIVLLYLILLIILVLVQIIGSRSSRSVAILFVFDSLLCLVHRLAFFAFCRHQ